MSEHTSSHDEEFERRVADGDFAGVREALAGCDVCSVRLAEFEVVASRIDQEFARERDGDLSDAAELLQSEGEETVEALFLRLAEEEKVAGAGLRWSRWAISGGVAAAILLTAFGYRWFCRDAPVGPIILHGKSLEIVSPTGDNSDFSRFAWRGELPAGGSYQVRIYDGESESSGPLQIERDLMELEWTPTATELNALPRTIRWQLLSITHDGRIHDSATTSARRSD